MIRILQERVLEGNTRYIEVAGNADDTPPTANVCTGSLFFIDGGKVQMFDETSGEWHDFADFGGGS